MSTTRRYAATGGVLFFITHITSVGAAALFGALRDTPGTITAGGTGDVALAAWLEIILALTVVGTAVALYPLIKDKHPSLALGYLALRGLEAAIIATGAAASLGILTLSHEAGEATAGTQALAAVHGWTFVFGPGLVCPIETILLALALWQSRMVPRWIPTLGVVGSVLIFGVNTLVLFTRQGFYPMNAAFDAQPALGALVAPIFLWEISLAFYLIAKGVRTPRNA